MGLPPINIPVDASPSVRRAFMDVREQLLAISANGSDVKRLFNLNVLGQRNDGAILMGTPNGPKWMDFETFARLLMGTALYKNLVKSIDDPSRFDYLGEKVKALLLPDIAEIAAQRGADIQRLDQKLQSAIESFAAETLEVTASIAGAAAGVRQTIFAEANNMRAAAGVVTQVKARLDGFNGGEATIEETMTAVADRATGLEAQWTLKANAGGAFAAIGLAATESTAGATDSSIIFVADRLAFVRASDVAGADFDPHNPDPSLIPFGVDASGVYINGFVRINAGGGTLADLSKSVSLSVPTQAFKQSADGSWDRASIIITATAHGGLTATPTWSVVSGAYTGLLAPGATLTVDRTLMTTPTVTFRATVTDLASSYSDDITLVKLVDGANAVTAYLTNEAVTVPATSAGVVSSYAGASGSMKVFNGTTDVTSSCAFSIQSNLDGITGSIGAATGAYSFTASGSWTNSSRTSNITLRATYNGVNYDKVFTITKSVAGSAGAAGNDGPRGSLTGYGSLYGIYFTGASWADGVGTTNANRANAVIYNMLNGTSLTTQSSTAHLQVGDTVTLTNGASPTASYTKFWSGSQWLTPGVIIDGNLLVLGTVSALMFDGVGLRIGSGRSPSGKAFEVNSAGVVWSDNLFITRGGSFSNDSGDSSGPLTATVQSNHPAVVGAVAASQSGTSAHGVRGINNKNGSAAFIGGGNGYDVYADGAGTNYGPFTGTHDALTPCESPIEEGSIVMDLDCIERRGWSGTLFTVEKSSAAYQVGAIGVTAAPPVPLAQRHLSAFVDHFDETGQAVMKASYDAYKDSHLALAANAVGEGQMRVCGEGGDIARGEFLCTSSTPGVGMRQTPFVMTRPDGSTMLAQVHCAFTVAKAREAVAFDQPGEVKTIAVTYHCG